MKLKILGYYSIAMIILNFGSYFFLVKPMDLISIVLGVVIFLPVLTYLILSLKAQQKAQKKL